MAAFRTWFLSQLETSDLLLRELRGDGPRSSAAGQLQSVMNRLGLIAGVLLRMSSGEVLNSYFSRLAAGRHMLAASVHRCPECCLVPMLPRGPLLHPRL